MTTVWRPLTTKIAAIALFALSASTAGAGEIALTVQGKTDYVIVEASAASPAEAFAARELARFVRQSSAADLPLVKEPDFKGGRPAFYVGRTEHAVRRGIDVDKLGPEEWVIRVVGKDVVIAGGRPRGTLYGVYEFLERCIGVRFLDAHTEFVPDRAALTLSDHLALRAKPAFFRREIFMVVPHHAGHVLFHVRRKLNSFGNAAVASAGPELGFCVLFGSPYSTHTHHLYAKHFPADRPEYFALLERGGRAGAGPDGQVCMSHPEVRRLFAAQLRQYLRQDRERIAKAATGEPVPFLYDLTPNDNGNQCVCDRCKALAAKYGAYSGVVLDFTNAIADAIAKDHPEVLVQTAAYTFYLDPPRGIVPRDNVVVRMAQLGVEFNAPPPRDTLRGMLHPVNARAREAFEARAKVSKTLGVHDYWTAWNQPFQWPHANIHGLAQTLRFYFRHGVRDLLVEDELMGSRLHNFVDLQFYLASRLLDDPHQDEGPIIAEFMKLYYGPAAPAMTRLLDYLEKRQDEEPSMLAAVPPSARKYFGLRYFVETDALLGEAEAAVAGDARRTAAIRQERLALDETMLFLWNALEQNGRLPFRRQEVLDRLQQNYAAAYRKYGGWGSEKADAERLEYLRNMPPTPPQFAGKKIIDLCGPQLNLRRAAGPFARQVSDGDAALGKAWLLDVTMQGPPGRHDRPPEFGLYDNRSRQLVTRKLAGGEVPKDEKYHFYLAGRIKGSQNLCFWAHHSWRLAESLLMTYNAALPEQALYEVHASMKFEGPAYVPGSTRTSAWSIDRLILVEVTGTGGTP